MRKFKSYTKSLMLVFAFSVITITTLGQTKIVKANDEVNHGDEIELEIDKKTGIATPESVLERYLKKVEFIEGNTSFDENCYGYWEGEVYLKNFRKDGNTKEEWEKMTNLEKFNYNMLVTQPKYYTDAVDEEEYVSTLSENVKKLLKYVDNGDVVCNALEEVWSWQYQYYTIYATTYDFYNMDATTTDNSEKEEKPINIQEELSESDAEELNELQQEIEKEINEDNKEDNFFVSFIKNYTLTFILVIVACVIGVIVYFRKNDKI